MDGGLLPFQRMTITWMHLYAGPSLVRHHGKRAPFFSYEVQEAADLLAWGDLTDADGKSHRVDWVMVTLE